ncbi:hypothetical protein HOD08_03910 [bacterium]|nr:hypothetical protein [bacterium]
MKKCVAIILVLCAGVESFSAPGDGPNLLDQQVLDPLEDRGVFASVPNHSMRGITRNIVVGLQLCPEKIKSWLNFRNICTICLPELSHVSVYKLASEICRIAKEEYLRDECDKRRTKGIITLLACCIYVTEPAGEYPRKFFFDDLPLVEKYLKKICTELIALDWAGGMHLPPGWWGRAGGLESFLEGVEAGEKWLLKVLRATNSETWNVRLVSRAAGFEIQELSQLVDQFLDEQRGNGASQKEFCADAWTPLNILVLWFRQKHRKICPECAAFRPCPQTKQKYKKVV